MPPKKRPATGQGPKDKAPKKGKSKKDNDKDKDMSTGMSMQDIEKIAAAAAANAVKEALKSIQSNENNDIPEIPDNHPQNPSHGATSQPAQTSQLDGSTTTAAATAAASATAAAATTAAALPSADSRGNPPKQLLEGRGVQSNSLPRIDVISPELRRQILSGIDVNLASLLIDDTDQNRTITFKDQVIDLHPLTDHRLTRPLTLQEFITAFSIYKSVMCSAFPSRVKELDDYQRDIIEMATDYDGFGFYYYHKAFAARSYQFLSQHQIKIDWSVIDDKLYRRYVACTKPNICGLCHSPTHLTSFCPEMASKPYKPQGNASKFSNFSTSGPGRIIKPPRSEDKNGRKIITIGGKEVCNNFNSTAGCKFDTCYHAHVCTKCLKAHGFGQPCPQGKKVTK